MVNEDIITSLKNAVGHGESIETAMETAVSSGYNQREVEEAAKFVGKGVIPITKIKPEEMLTMPNKKGFFSKTEKKPPVPIQQVQQPKPMLLPQKTPVYKEQVQNIQKSSSQQLPAFSQPKPQPQVLQQAQTQKPIQSQPIQNIKIQLQQMPQAKQAPAKKQSYIKEIILLILLLILIGILIIVVKFKEQIINFFS